MKSFTYIIKDSAGIHVRPAGELAKMAKGCQSTITLKAKGKETDVKKLMAVMALCIKQGETVDVEINGDDEETVYRQVLDFFETNL